MKRLLTNGLVLLFLAAIVSGGCDRIGSVPDPPGCPLMDSAPPPIALSMNHALGALIAPVNETQFSPPYCYTERGGVDTIYGATELTQCGAVIQTPCIRRTMSGVSFHLSAADGITDPYCFVALTGRAFGLLATATLEMYSDAPEQPLDIQQAKIELMDQEDASLIFLTSNGVRLRGRSTGKAMAMARLDGRNSRLDVESLRVLCLSVEDARVYAAQIGRRLVDWF